MGTYWFINDVNTLVIFPIEQMVHLVQRISKNPLAVEYRMPGPKEGFKEGMETTMLLQTINKIGGLMRVCFGEAGASVIARNLMESKKNRLNLMGPGKMIHSIFGFVDIRSFTDTTECLQEEVMLFINRIAYILHGIVVQCSGSANKNIGDAFLLTWKIDESCNSNTVSRLADQALLCFCRTLIEISRHHEFICDFSEEAAERLTKRFPSYQVRIGCGLHVGWAVEGAIGTHRKIDASYLSPHVNLCMYLEDSTKKYGVPLLMSESFYHILSPAVSKYCRLVDRIRRRATEAPFGLYTYDADTSIDFTNPFLTEASLHASAIHESNLKRLSQARTLLGIGPGNNVGLGLPMRMDRGPVNRGKRRRTSADAVVLAGMKEFRAGPAALRERVPVVARERERERDRDRERERDRERGSPVTRDKERAMPLAREPSSRDAIRKQNSDNSLNLSEHKPKKSPEVPKIVLPPYDPSVWETDEDLKMLRRNFTEKFRDRWEDAMHAYIDGNWPEARDILETLTRKDKVSAFLLQVLNSCGGHAPENWNGYRSEFS